MRLKIVSLVVLVFSAVHAPAQSPEQVVTSYFQTLKTGGTKTVATLMHPDELSKFHQMLTPVIQASLSSDRERKLFEKFADRDDPSRMRTLSDFEFMNLFMEWMEGINPEITAIMKEATVEALGHIREGDIKHVVVRMKLKSEGIEIERMSVLSVKDYQGIPKMILTGEMKGMAEALKRRR